MSLERPNQSTYISPEEYEGNQAKIEQAKKYLASLTEMNNAGLQRFEELEAKKHELQRKIEEGAQAQRVMEQLERLQAQSSSTRLLENGSGQDPSFSSARIEEVRPGDFLQRPEPSVGRNLQRRHSPQPLQYGSINSTAAMNSLQFQPKPQAQQRTTNNALILVPPHPTTSVSSHRQATLQTHEPFVPPISSNLGVSNPSSFPHTSSGNVQQTRSTQPMRPPKVPTVISIPPGPSFSHHNNLGVSNPSSFPRTSSGNVQQTRSTQPMRPPEVPTVISIPPGPSFSHHKYVPPPTYGMQQVQSYESLAMAGRSSYQEYHGPATHQTQTPEFVPSIYQPSKSGAQPTNQIGQHKTVKTDSLLKNTESLPSPLPTQAPPTPSFLPQRHIVMPDQGESPLIPYLDIPDQEVYNLRHRVAGFERQAPINTISKLHPKVAVYKDKSSVIWIYVPAPQGGYWRYRDVDKFFGCQLSIAKPHGAQSQNPSALEAPWQASDTSQQTSKTPSQPPCQPNIGSFPSPSDNANPNAIVHIPERTPPKTPPKIAIPSGLTSPERPLSQVDKKHLSKHIIFALGKRPREPSTLSIGDEQPAKKRASDAIMKSQLELNESTTNSSVAAPTMLRPVANTAILHSLTTPSHTMSIVLPTLPASVSSTVPAKSHRSPTRSEKTGSRPPTPIAHRVTTGTMAASRIETPSSEQPVASSSKTTPAVSSQVTLNPNIPLEKNPYTHLLWTQNNQNSSMLPPANIPSSAPAGGSSSNAEAGSSKVKEPLFLPSVSPEPGLLYRFGPNVTAGSSIVVAGKKKLQVYVLVPPPPVYLVHYRKRMAVKRRSRFLDGDEGANTRDSSGSGMLEKRLWKKYTPASAVSTSVVGEDVRALESQRDSPVDEREQEAIRLACSRLQEVPCRWDGCDVIMNCVDSLVLHLNEHRPPPSPNNRYFTCRWTQCGRRSDYNEMHMEKHASLPLRCAYKDCADTFRSGSRLTKHFQARHRNDTLKPAAKLCNPTLEAPPDIHGVIPAYLFVTKLVEPATISNTRHRQICPVVVRNIVNSDQEKPARQRTRKTARSSNRQALLAAGANNDYEFMTTRSTRYSSYLSQPVDIPLEDLDSSRISKMVDEGLMLWTPEGGTDNEGEGDATKPSTNQPLTQGIIKDDEASDGELPGLDLAAVSYVPDSSHHEHRSDDEDVVEGMLTEVSMQ